MTILSFRVPDSESAGPADAEESEVREPEFDDVEVMRRLASGDTAALQQIIDRFWVPLSSYASRMLDDVDAAEDVTQRTFIRLWDRRAEWRVGSLHSYLFRLTRNFAVDAIREAKARVRRERAKGLEASTESHTPLEPFERDRDDVSARVDAAIQALPPRRREVFTLAYLRGLSYRQIAEVMSISAKTVGNQMTAALAELRASLEPLLDRPSAPSPRLEDLRDRRHERRE